MCHPSVLAWTAYTVERHGLRLQPTLEVGSYNANGTVRPFFDGPYLGVDSRPGPAVDMVASCNRLPFADGTWPTVVSTEMLEHDPAPWLSLPEIGRVLTDGGWLLLTTRGPGFPIHEHPSDFWRFTPMAAPLLADLAGLRLVSVEADPEADGIFMVARKDSQ